ncbi:MAG: alkaline phosphatase family protein [Candidatus Baltobacteraceae bacterium]
MSSPRLTFLRSAAAVLAVVLGVASCAGSASQAPGGIAVPANVSPGTGSGGSGSSNYIQHVIVVVQENRSFDNLFATYPGADGATQGLMETPSGDQYVQLKAVDLSYKCDLGHRYPGFLKDYDGGKMDGFSLEGGGGACPGKATTAPYQYVKPSEIKPYWDIAQQYVLADHLFQTQGSGSFTAHQDLIAGGTMINQSQTKSLVDYPSKVPWGCDAPPGTVTSLLISTAKKLEYRYDKGPFPCLKYATLRDLLDAKRVSWKLYSPPTSGGQGGGMWNPFEAIKAVRDGPEWNTNISIPETNIFNDISGGTLPAVSWLIPDKENSDHPGTGKDTGPSWVASVVNAIGESPYWNSTAIVIVWDDWGGFYDNVPPPFFDRWGGLGFRVPMLVVSAYARQGPSSQSYISHTQYEFGSIVKFIENVWGLGQLGTTDARAASIVDCFDFTQQPRTFSPIGSKYSRAFFLRQKPSYEPVDTE